MQEIIIRTNEANQRFDKYLKKYLSNAPSSFVYKMLRKKNITLNGKKADGSEKVNENDKVCLFLADETIAKFRSLPQAETQKDSSKYIEAYLKWKKEISHIYEDEHIILLNKPSSILSQMADGKELSINEYLIGYLIETKAITTEDLLTFKPSICNRLDRNTSGLIICGKSLLGIQKMSELLKVRTLHKYYRCYVVGEMTKSAYLEGYLSKDEKLNKVTILKEVPNAIKDSYSYIQTGYEPLESHYNKTLEHSITLLEVELITGKTHQIRAHLASIGHAILGDFKYGNTLINKKAKTYYKIDDQLLHAYRIVFPTIDGTFSYLSGKEFFAELPNAFARI